MVFGINMRFPNFSGKTTSDFERFTATSENFVYVLLIFLPEKDNLGTIDAKLTLE